MGVAKNKRRVEKAADSSEFEASEDRDREDSIVVLSEDEVEDEVVEMDAMVRMSRGTRSRPRAVVSIK